jgi:hypothetical protein
LVHTTQRDVGGRQIFDFAGGSIYYFQLPWLPPVLMEPMDLVLKLNAMLPHQLLKTTRTLSSTVPLSICFLPSSPVPQNQLSMRTRLVWIEPTLGLMIKLWKELGFGLQLAIRPITTTGTVVNPVVGPQKIVLRFMRMENGMISTALQ